jgi:hypothetical protein
MDYYAMCNESILYMLLWSNSEAHFEHLLSIFKEWCGLLCHVQCVHIIYAIMEKFSSTFRALFKHILSIFKEWYGLFCNVQ